MRVLIVSPMFPPLSEPEAICTGKFVQALMEFGSDASVIVCSNVVQKPRWDTSNFWTSVRTVSVDVPRQPGTPLVLRCWHGLRYQTTACGRWVRATVAKALELHRKNPFDLVISRSLPNEGHLAGYWVASALRIPWLASVNDPWDISPFVSIESQRKDWTPDMNWRIWWWRVIGRADAISFPCERLRRYCLQGAERQSNAVIVPHIGTASPCVHNHQGEFVIVYAGRLGINELTGRSAAALLEGAVELFRLRPASRAMTRIVFVGPEDPEAGRQIAARGLSDNVVCTGFVSYEESLEHMMKATVCVLIESDLKEGVFLPSKLCDYIVARKPVLALSPAVGTAADLAREGGIQVVRPKDAMGAGQALVELYDAFIASRLDSYRPPEALVRRFEAKRVMQDFYALVADLTNGQARSEQATL
jgi:glycosyltransferase involved in cell wall biosynthesis